jgi:hypothetical protein
MGAGLGEYIDSFKYVFRFPYLGNWQEPEHYGVKTSYYCGTVSRTLQRLRSDKPERGYYFWSKYIGYAIPKALSVMTEWCGGEDVSGLIHKWQAQLPSLSYKHISHGTAGVCIAASRIGLPIVALGCDNLKEGKDIDGDYVGSWNYEGRFETGMKIRETGSHTLYEELKLIRAMEKYYSLSVDFR